jgi:hypothetical protein
MLRLAKGSSEIEEGGKLRVPIAEFDGQGGHAFVDVNGLLESACLQQGAPEV